MMEVITDKYLFIDRIKLYKSIFYFNDKYFSIIHYYDVSMKYPINFQIFDILQQLTKQI